MESIESKQILLEILNALKKLNENYQSKELPVLSVPDQEQWLHTQQVMDIFGTSCPKTLYNWRKKNLIISKKFGRYVYYLKSDLYRAFREEPGQDDR
jgi:hypothetical protein